MIFFNVIFFVLFSLNSTYAQTIVEWNDLQTGESYLLEKNLSLSIKSPLLKTTTEKYHLFSGESFFLQQISHLDIPGFPLNLYIFLKEKCSEEDVLVKTELEIIPLSFLENEREVGVEIESCQLSVYVEVKDLFSRSLFREAFFAKDKSQSVKQSTLKNERLNQ